MKKFKYKFRNLPLLHCYNCREILEESNQISFDLGLSKERVEFLDAGKLKIRDFYLEIREIEKIAKDESNSIFAVEKDKIYKLLFFDKSVYKLRLVEPCAAPTLEINGIHMHRIKNITPWEDTKKKLSCINVKNKKVLDICTGLGYTAIMSKILGCKEVITIEKDENVLKIAEYNPWSRDLENIEIINEDAFYAIDNLNEKFDVIILDPPRFSIAKDLYSMGFYSKLKERIRSGGVIFHYTGEVWKKRGKLFWKEVAEKLKKVGLKGIKYHHHALGLTARF